MQMARSRPKEKVNGQAHAAGRGLFQQMQRAVQEGHVPFGRDDVGAVGLDRHPVLNFVNLHPGIAPDQLGEDALMVRGQVLHQDKGHAGIGVGGHGGKERLKRRQPPCRRADADDGKTLLGDVHRPLVLFGLFGLFDDGRLFPLLFRPLSIFLPRPFFLSCHAEPPYLPPDPTDLYPRTVLWG
jgi:hypothetical protein